MDAKKNACVVRRLEFALAAVGVALVSSAGPPAAAARSIAANEAAAIATLLKIAQAQRAFVDAVEIDTDDDGVGEYGYLAELSGAQPMRYSEAGVPAPGVHGLDELFPPLLRRNFGKLRFSAVVQGGYVFQLWLPTHSFGGPTAGMAEDFFGGKLAAPFPDPLNGAKYWCCYAWPLAFDRTGRRVFVINQRDAVLGYANDSPAPLSGPNVPSYDEAFEVSRDMSSPLRMGVPGGNLESIWTPVP